MVWTGQCLAGHRPGWPWSGLAVTWSGPGQCRAALDWAGTAPDWPWLKMAVAWAGTGPSWPLVIGCAGLAVGWASYGLLWSIAGLDMCCSYHDLGWPSDLWFFGFTGHGGHGICWPWTILAMGGSSYQLV
jgi:hypothetical protein